MKRESLYAKYQNYTADKISVVKSRYWGEWFVVDDVHPVGERITENFPTWREAYDWAYANA